MGVAGPPAGCSAMGTEAPVVVADGAAAVTAVAMGMFKASTATAVAGGGSKALPAAAAAGTP